MSIVELGAEITFVPYYCKIPTLNELTNYFNLTLRIEVVVTMIICWLTLRHTVKVFTPSHSSKVLVLIHAFLMLVINAQVLSYLCSKSLHYPDIYISMREYHQELRVTTVIGSYVSLTYFIHDSFYIHSAYIKHHIGACFVYMLCFYHTEVSLLHCIAGIGFFELGAVLVQLSRAFPKSLLLRTFVCIGYAASRLALGWYYGFFVYQAMTDWHSFSVLQRIFHFPINGSIVFLLIINFRWTFLQWRSLGRAFAARFAEKPDTEKSFFELHQQILGNVPSSQASV